MSRAGGSAWAPRRPEKRPFGDCDGSIACGGGSTVAGLTGGLTQLLFVETAPELVWAGNGRGEYAMESRYSYVGTGEGEFKVVTKRRLNRPGVKALCSTLIGVVLVTVLLVHFVLRLLLAPPAQSTTPAPLFECVTDRLVAAWGPAKQDWCCRNAGRGCAGQRPQPHGDAQPAVAPYDCMDGPPEGASAWPEAKQAWCCKDMGMGCTTTRLPPPQVLSPVLSAAPAMPATSAEATAAALGQAMPARSAEATAAALGHSPESESFNCDAGFDRWALAWSVRKQAWCCEHANRSCPGPSAAGPPSPSRAAAAVLGQPSPFDCDHGLQNWMAEWTVQKAAWCCEHNGRGCNALVSPRPAAAVGAAAPPAGTFDCGAGFQDWQAGWSVGKKAWCCLHSGKGCLTAAVADALPGAVSLPGAAGDAAAVLPHNCTASAVEVEAGWAGWSVAKRIYCCRHSGKGCLPTGEEDDAR